MSQISSYWWEEGDFHTIEDGKHFVYTNATVIDHNVVLSQDGKNTLVKSEKLEYYKREPIEVIEVPFD